MIGRSFVDETPAEAIPWFHRVHELAGAGYPDSLGLAVASLGWEARALLELGQYDRAVHLYFDQLAAGDPTALPSLQRAARQALDTDAGTLQKLAGDATVRGTITAYVVSLGGPLQRRPPPEVSKRWATAIARAHVLPAEDADRLAWAAYQAGEMDLAEQWLRLAPRASAVTRWLRAKLLVRGEDRAGFGGARRDRGWVPAEGPAAWLLVDGEPGGAPTHMAPGC